MKNSNSRLNSIRRANNSNKEIQTERMEDYLEIIYELVQLKGYAICVDISGCIYFKSNKNDAKTSYYRIFKIRKISGNTTYRTSTNIAMSVRKRHELFIDFFRMIGVNKDMAIADAEGIEHHLHFETLEKLEEFLNTNRKNNSKFVLVTH
jgi:Mn-dependent DtxR family transcriptional regulator